MLELQQCLPFTVLKRTVRQYNFLNNFVATVLTVYGIETMEIAEDVFSENGVGLQQCLPFTVLKLN